MTLQPRSATRYQSLRTSRRVLARTAPLVRYGIFAFGVMLFLERVEPMLTDAEFTWGERRVMGIVALSTLGAFGLAGWLAGRLIKAAAEVIDVFIDGADAATRAADLIELQMVPTLGRIANALERQAGTGREPNRDQSVADVRRAIADQRWDQAERMIAEFTRDQPNAPEAAILADEFTKARDAVVESLRAQLETARDANDPARVIDARDALTQHLRGAALNELDQKVVRWLYHTIQKRIRTGDIDVEVADLAARIGDSFGDTPEGAILQEALPKLRRSAGLCPRCARPYQGDADACPRCLTNGADVSSSAPRPATKSREKR